MLGIGYASMISGCPIAIAERQRVQCATGGQVGSHRIRCGDHGGAALGIERVDEGGTVKLSTVIIGTVPPQRSFRDLPIRVHDIVVGIAVKMVHAGQRVGRRARGAVENETGLPSLDGARDPPGTVPQNQLVGSDGQFDRAIGADAVRPFTSAGEIEISVGWIREAGPAVASIWPRRRWPVC